MRDATYFFGKLFREWRTAADISLWGLALKMSYHIRNLQRIEKGEQQPGVNLALRLLHAIGAEPGAFMQKLSHESQPCLPQSLSAIEHVTVSYIIPHIQEGQKSLFGLFLVQARVAGTVSQTAMAKAAGYNLRNINGVESGKQDPGIMTALALVRTTGVDIADFFNTLYLCWQEYERYKKYNTHLTC